MQTSSDVVEDLGSVFLKTIHDSLHIEEGLPIALEPVEIPLDG